MKLSEIKKKISGDGRATLALNIVSGVAVLTALGWLVLVSLSGVKSSASAEQKAVIEIDKSAYREVEKYLVRISNYQPGSSLGEHANPEPFREYQKKPTIAPPLIDQEPPQEEAVTDPSEESNN